MAKRAGKAAVVEDELMPDIVVEDNTNNQAEEKKADVEKIIVTPDDDNDDDGEEIVSNLKKQVATLTKENESEKSRREDAEKARIAAEKVRTEATAGAAVSFQKQIEAQEASIENGVIAALSELEAAKQEYSRARTEGDVTSEVTAMERLSRAMRQADDWKSEKDNFANWKKTEGDRAVAEAKTARQPVYGPKTQEFIDKHPQYNTDPEYRENAGHFHAMALKKGLLHESKDYFDFVHDKLEKIYGESKSTKEADPVTEVKVEKSGIDPASYAASPSRDGGSSSSSEKRQLKFTPSQMSIIKERAAADGISVEKAALRYQANKERLVKEGRL